jgi:hypothetical protein
MDHRLFAVLAIVSFALGGSGCASKSERAQREQILMPLQTGSTLQRRIMVETPGETEKPAEKPVEKKEPKRKSPKPPAPKPSPAQPEEESTPAPDRFR